MANEQESCVIGNPEQMQTLYSITSAAGTERCRAMEVPGVGCLVLFSMESANGICLPVSTFIPGTRIVPDRNGGNRVEKE